jgi:flagellar biosynthetic protein FlhB
MADGGSGEKTEEATPERLRKLRQEGNVAKSKDINSAIMFLVVFIVLGMTFPWITQNMVALVELSIRVSQEIGLPHGPRLQVAVAALLAEGLKTMFIVIAPVMGTELVLGIALNLAQVGFLFSLKPITPDLNKVNPINGFKGLFNMKKVVELLKTVIKFVVIAWLSYEALKKALHDVVYIIRSDMFIGVKVMGMIIWDFVSKIGVVFIIIAAFDAFYQKKRYLKDNMMTKYDVKQEYKQSEGDPQHKSERRKLHQEILSGGGGSAVKGADVVVRNPDHIAVALKYERDKGHAPTVVAKGQRIWAEKILAAAEQYGVPVVRNVPLAQALGKLDVGDEIPEELYQAVAEVLTFVYNLSQEQKKKRG